MQKVLEKIETEPLPRVLFVHGPETVWHDRVQSVLEKRSSEGSFGEWNWSVYYGGKEFDLEGLLVELAMVPWGDSPKIILLKKAELISADTMGKLATWLEEHPQSNCLAIFLDKVDGRWKYPKTLRKFALEIDCKPLQGDALVRHVLDYCTEQGKRMNRDTAMLFVDRVGSDLLLIHNELEKLLAWCGEREKITSVDVQTISSLSPGQIQERTIFQMTDRIVRKQRNEALDILSLLLTSGEPALRILPVIERQLRLVLAAKTTTANLEETAKQMGETSSYALKKVAGQAKKFSLQELLEGFRAVLYADRELKLGVPGEQVLTDLIVKLT